MTVQISHSGVVSSLVVIAFCLVRFQVTCQVFNAHVLQMDQTLQLAHLHLQDLQKKTFFFFLLLIVAHLFHYTASLSACRCDRRWKRKKVTSAEQLVTHCWNSIWHITHVSHSLPSFSLLMAVPHTDSLETELQMFYPECALSVSLCFCKYLHTLLQSHHILLFFLQQESHTRVQVS